MFVYILTGAAVSSVTELIFMISHGMHKCNSFFTTKMLIVNVDKKLKLCYIQIIHISCVRYKRGFPGEKPCGNLLFYEENYLNGRH